MSDVTLYRKYRPKSFDDVIGQDHIVNALRGALKEDNVAHAYLFAGTRGTGKTSVARILAREVGCSDNDLVEIDAASNRGIDDVRQLRDSVQTLPFESTKKIYIIDEVHMLTKEAFNALLKTLEEPPRHVIFILATTEIEKLPDTVISRCQSFTFKKPTQAILKDVVLNVSKKEKFKVDASAAELIALLGDGSFRDTLGILQKVINSSDDKKITAEEVAVVTGAPKRELVESIISAIAENDLASALQALNKAVEGNVNMKLFLKLLLSKIRLIILLRYAKDMEKDIQAEVDADEYDFLKKMSSEKSISSRTLSELLQAYTELEMTHIPQLPIELALVRLMGDDAN